MAPGARPDWILVLVVCWALYTRRNDAYWACLLLGFAADLATVERFGLLTICYGLIGVAVHALRSGLFLKRATTHFAVTFGAALVLQAVLGAYHLAVYPHSAEGVGSVALVGILSALYTALWAPPILHVLVKISGVLRLHTSRHTHVGRRKPRTARV
ncbi:MAG: rod shape-determining protein MreD [Planctomycetes bacterium]|nr:rod shape-determining protein MreD [Planctomycetota bacterium]